MWGSANPLNSRVAEGDQGASRGRSGSLSVSPFGNARKSRAGLLSSAHGALRSRMRRGSTGGSETGLALEHILSGSPSSRAGLLGQNRDRDAVHFAHKSSSASAGNESDGEGGPMAQSTVGAPQRAGTSQLTATGVGFAPRSKLGIGAMTILVRQALRMHRSYSGSTGFASSSTANGGGSASGAEAGDDGTASQTANSRELYVEVRIQGSASDNRVVRTKSVREGRILQWDEHLSFVLSDSEASLLIFRIVDARTESVVAYRACFANCVAPGQADFLLMDAPRGYDAWSSSTGVFALSCEFTPTYCYFSPVTGENVLFDTSIPPTLSTPARVSLLELTIMSIRPTMSQEDLETMFKVTGGGGTSSTDLTADLGGSGTRLLPWRRSRRARRTSFYSQFDPYVRVSVLGHGLDTKKMRTPRLSENSILAEARAEANAFTTGANAPAALPQASSPSADGSGSRRPTLLGSAAAAVVSKVGGSPTSPSAPSGTGSQGSAAYQAQWIHTMEIPLLWSDFAFLQFALCSKRGPRRGSITQRAGLTSAKDQDLCAATLWAGALRKGYRNVRLYSSASGEHLFTLLCHVRVRLTFDAFPFLVPPPPPRRPAPKVYLLD